MQKPLQPETSEAYTLGLVYTPTWIDMKISLDYFDIEIHDEITELSEARILASCYQAEIGDNDFCNLFERRAATDPTAPFAIDRIEWFDINIARQWQRGLSFAFEHHREVDIGAFDFELGIDWFLERERSEFGEEFESGIDTDQLNGLLGFPSVTASGNVSFTRNDWTVSWSTEFLGRTDSNRLSALDYNEPQDYFGQSAQYKAYAEAHYEHTLAVEWTGNVWSVSAGIANVFDERPPYVSRAVSPLGNVPIGNYDLNGRTFQFSLGRKF